MFLGMLMAANVIDYLYSSQSIFDLFITSAALVNLDELQILFGNGRFFRTLLSSTALIIPLNLITRSPYLFKSIISNLITTWVLIAPLPFEKRQVINLFGPSLPLLLIHGRSLIPSVIIGIFVATLVHYSKITDHPAWTGIQRIFEKKETKVVPIEASILAIVEMGFTRDEAIEKLVMNDGDVELAVSSLLID